jgi:hypothetical protein
MAHLSAFILSLLMGAPPKGFGEQPQYEDQGNHGQSVARNGPLSGAAQHIFNLPVCPSPLRPEYHAPPVHVCACSPSP